MTTNRLMTTELAAVFLATLTLFGTFWASIGGFTTATAPRSLAASRQ
jgi:hypothetical protein